MSVITMPPTKYRGFNGTEWVYGYYEFDETLDEHFIRKNGVVWEVDPESIGHWTGVISSEQNLEIYSGDIVEAWSEGCHGTFEVVWRHQGSPTYLLYPAWHDRKFWHIQASMNLPNKYYDRLKIIGNRFENPEMKKLLTTI